MAFLRNISDRFWNYVSPRKTQQKREKPFKVPAIPQRAAKLPAKLPRRSMTPNTRVETWNVKAESVAAHDVPPSPLSLARSYTDFEGDTLIDEIVEGIEDEHGVDANDETIVVDESRYDTKNYDPETERLRREAQGYELRAAGWSEDAVFLFQKLGMRGFEPLMPSAWSFDFVMMPPMMFTDNIDKAYIKSACGKDYHAEKALQELLQVGGRARDALLTNAPVRTAEEHIRRGIRRYHKWAIKDGKVDKAWNLPLFEVVSGSRDISASDLQDKMLWKLDHLAAQWRDALRVRASVEADGGAEIQDGSDDTLIEKDFIREPPTLYGVICSHTIMGFVSYDIMAKNPTLRTVAIFDFGREDYDVWNSLAIAIFVLHCRNRMMELKEDLQTYESSDSSDPDA